MTKVPGLTEGPLAFGDWLERKLTDTKLRACELTLSTFRASADADPAHLAAVGETVWGFLIGGKADASTAGSLIASTRDKLDALRPDQLEALGRKLEAAAGQCSDVEAISGRLVSAWFRAIALSRSPFADPCRAGHVARSFERALVALARLSDRAQPPASGSDQKDGIAAVAA
jgi:hypothetical protein